MHALATFPAERDPRVDPRPGDEFARHDGIVKVFAITSVASKGWFVEYHVLPHDQAIAPFIEQVSLQTFRRFAAVWHA